MSSSFVFTSLSFRLISVSQRTSNSVRIYYSAVPKQVSASNSDDALNPGNYTFVGPTYIPITNVASVSGNTLAMDVFFASALTTGSWSVTVANVQNAASTTIGSPSTLNFSVAARGNTSPVTAGAVEESPDRVIRKHLNSLLRGDNWDALIEALSYGDNINWENVQRTAQQVFLSTSSSKYLTRNAADVGIDRPDIGMSDELFRALAIAVTAKKLTHPALNKILNIFFGDDATRAWTETELTEPYALSDGMYVDIVLDKDSDQTYRVFFSDADFADISQATAMEVANTINSYLRQFTGQGFAVPYINPETGTYKVRVYSGSLGVRSFIQVSGGSAQPYLQFSTYLDVYTGSVTSADTYDWLYSNPEQGQTRIELTEASPKINLSDVQTGDYVVIGADANSVEGTYAIAEIERSYNGSAWVQAIIIDEDLDFTGAATQDSNYAYQFFRPSVDSTTNDGQATVALTQTTFKQINITIPPTTRVVNRSYSNAAYIKGNEAADIKRFVRDVDGVLTIETSAAHGLAEGDKILLEGLVGDSSAPWQSAEVTGSEMTGGSYVSWFSGTANTAAQQAQESQMVVLNDDSVLICGGFTTTAGVSNGETDVCNRIEIVGATPDTSGQESADANKWEYSLTAVTNMNTSRVKHTATTLNDGRVLVAGGYDGADETDTCEFYNPFDDSWTDTNPLLSPRYGHKSVKLADGRVLVAGGYGTLNLLNSCEIFDPTTGVFTAAANLPANAGWYAFNLIPLTGQGDYEAMLVGGFVDGGNTPQPEGYDWSGTVTNRCFWYDANLDAWEEVGAMRYGRVLNGIQTLPDGRILVFGGMGRDLGVVAPAADLGTTAVWPNECLQSSEIFDPDTRRWYKYTTLPYTTVEPMSAVLSDGTVWINGGYSFEISYVSDTVVGPTTNYQGCLLDPVTAKFSLNAKNTNTNRDNAILTESGLVVMSGGTNSASTTLDNLELWAPASQTVNSGGLNDTFEVTEVVNSTKFRVQTNTLSYASNFGSLLGGDVDVTASSLTPVYQSYTGWWAITNAARTANVTTLTISGHPFAVGDVVYVDINTANFTPGIYTITTVTPTTFTYSETASNVVSAAATGAVSLRTNVGEFSETAQSASASEFDMGPYLYDPQGTFSVTGTDTTLTVAVPKGSQQNVLTVTSTADWPDSLGYFVLDFGGETQSQPIKYLEKISPTELLIDYRYEFQANYAVGAKVTLLYSLGGWAPEAPDDAGSYYVTGSVQGRIYAQQFITDSAAGGFDIDFDIAYPSDAGLGGEGYATEGDTKLSDIAGVYGADEVV